MPIPRSVRPGTPVATRGAEDWPQSAARPATTLPAEVADVPAPSPTDGPALTLARCVQGRTLARDPVAAAAPASAAAPAKAATAPAAERWASAAEHDYVAPTVPSELPGSGPDAPAPFGGHAVIAGYAQTLADAWLAGGKKPPGWLKAAPKIAPAAAAKPATKAVAAPATAAARAPAGAAPAAAAPAAAAPPAAPAAVTPPVAPTERDLVVAGLADHYAHTMFRCKGMNGTIEQKRRAWMMARREEYEFFQHRYVNPTWADFPKSKPYARDRPSKILEQLSPGYGDYFQLATGFSSFLEQLTKERVDGKPVKFYAYNRKGHSTSAKSNQGLSVDIGLPKRTTPGFFDRAQALDFLQAVDQLARKQPGTQWSALYNDFNVAKVVNEKLGRTCVGFTGEGDSYHGPAPLVLHIHLEVVVPADQAIPEPAAAAAAATPAAGATPAAAPAAPAAAAKPG